LSSSRHKRFGEFIQSYGTEEKFQTLSDRLKDAGGFTMPAQVSNAEHTGAEHLCCSFYVNE
jgi:hypothetical protein